MAQVQSDEIIKTIKRIEKLRNSKVISMFLGTKPNLSTQIHSEQHRYIFELLEQIGMCEKIDLFLYTSGGDTLSPPRLTSLIREYCDTFSVLVPFRAMSSGTLLCLGANEIVMGKLGELSPVDPTTGNPFNPPNPSDENKIVQISVEDVTSFLALAEDVANIRGEDEMLKVFQDLTAERRLSLHPLALGNVYRALRLIRQIAFKQLKFHHGENESEKIDRIIENLTELLFSHGYQISRKEAIELELNITKPDVQIENEMWKLYRLYEDKIGMMEAFDPKMRVMQQFAQNPPQAIIPQNYQIPQNFNPQVFQQVMGIIGPQLLPPPITIPVKQEAAYLEIVNMCYSFIYEGEIRGQKEPNGKTNINVDIRGMWSKTR